MDRVTNATIFQDAAGAAEESTGVCLVLVIRTIPTFANNLTVAHGIARRKNANMRVLRWENTIRAFDSLHTFIFT